MEKYVQISKRLQEVARLVTKEKAVADVGCDHAYTSIYLVQQGIASKVIAMDVNRGPLERAKLNIEKYGMQQQIQTRLSDGIKELKPGGSTYIANSRYGWTIDAADFNGTSRSIRTSG